MTQLVEHLTYNWSAVNSNTIKCSRSFLEQETLPLLLSTGWFHEQNMSAK